MENEADAIILPRTEDLVGEEQDLENPVGPTVNEEVGEGNDPEDQVEPRHNTDQASTSSTIPTVNEEVGEGNGQAKLPPLPHYGGGVDYNAEVRGNSHVFRVGKNFVIVGDNSISVGDNSSVRVVGEGNDLENPVEPRRNTISTIPTVNEEVGGNNRVLSVGKNSVNVGDNSVSVGDHSFVSVVGAYSGPPGLRPIVSEVRSVGDNIVNVGNNSVNVGDNSLSVGDNSSVRVSFGEKSRRLKGNTKLGSDHEDDAIDDV